MDFPEKINLLHIAILLFLIGLFLFLSGLNIIKVEKIRILGGFKTWVIGLLLMIIGACIGIYNHKPDNKRNQNLKCEITISSHKDNDRVARSIRIEGGSTGCLKNKLYTLVLEDKDHDHYKQGDIKLMFGGAWSSFLSFGPAWANKPVTVKVVGYSKSTKWIKGNNKLPSDVDFYSKVTLDID